MRRPKSKFLKAGIRFAAVLALFGLSTWAPEVLAQACCAGASALTPGRLSLHEEAAVGLSLKVKDVLGSFDAKSRYLAAQAAGEVDFEQDVLGTLRVFSKGQVSALVPWVLTARSVPRLSDFGGGVGDVNLSGRYDFFGAGESLYLPGVAALLGVTFPTGRPPEYARRALATDATGMGAFQLNGGIALEQVYGRVLANFTGLVSQRTTRMVQGVSETLGLQVTGLGAVGYTFDNEATLALSFTYTSEQDATVSGQRVRGSGRALSVLGISGGLPLGEFWRLQGGILLDLPWTSFGRNQPAGPGFTFTVLRTWT